MTLTSQFAYMTLSSNFLDVFLFFLSSLVTDSSFNIIVSSGVMIIFFYKGLTINPEIGNTSVWVLPNIWDWGELGILKNTKLGTNISNKMLLNASKCQDYSFYHFWVIKSKPTVGEGGKIPPPLIRLGLKLPNFKQFQNIMRRGFMIDSQLSFNILPETTSWPWNCLDPNTGLLLVFYHGWN